MTPPTPSPAAAAAAPTGLAAIAARLGLRLDRGALVRMVAAGSAWGLVVSLGLTAARAWSCGTICPDAAALDAVVTAGLGIVTVGPLAALS
ncbi:hypothetical protein, partial [Rhodoplanes serenus]|uniref:hypothetical protein n=2 Tax=Rhodoplanes TaxID=29407 RepID=UPI001A91756E